MANSVNKYLKENILYENADYIFINKKAGLLSIPDRFDANKSHLKRILLTEYPEIFQLHKLDQNTSGVMVFAKNGEALRQCSKLFEARKFTEEYMALCINRPPEDKGIIEQPIKENRAKRGSYLISNLGKAAHTEYEILHEWKSHCLLKLSIKTGRKHQIRVHLAYIGCPLLVDPVYGHYTEYYLSSIKKKKVNVKKYNFILFSFILF